MAEAGDRGARGEEAAARFLARRGWRLLARNWRGGGGEIDLVASRRGLVAICEVKTRTSAAALEEPLTAAQRARILRAAAAFLASRPDLAQSPVRLDLLVVQPRRFWARVRHLAGAFEAPARGPQGSNRRSTG
jgi:putative endonuclease